jgi:gas vesicle protein
MDASKAGGSMKTLIAILCLSLAAPVFSSENSKDDMKEAGHSIRDAAKETGHAFKKAAKKIGHASKKAAKDVGHGVKKAADDVKKDSK